VQRLGDQEQALQLAEVDEPRPEPGEVGAEITVDYREENFIEIVKGATEGRGADVIFDPVGGDVFDGSRRCVAFEGRILVIGFAGGRGTYGKIVLRSDS
jgi:NADPH:quinone reductase-like Zn-dependent oxidoreductase